LSCQGSLFRRELGQVPRLAQATRVGQGKRLSAVDPVLRAGLFASPCGNSFHSRLVTIEKGDPVAEHGKLIDFQPARSRSP